MRARKPEPVSPWPEHLAEFDAALHEDEHDLALQRWQWWSEHPGQCDGIDPIDLLKARLETRRARQAKLRDNG